MFNEAFWFMYLVDLVGRVSALAGVIGAVIIFGVLACAAWIDCEYEAESKKMPRKIRDRIMYIGCPILLIVALTAFAVPSRTTLYAGAGQYVAEQTEITDTLMSLKDLVDQKIEEQLIEDAAE